MVTFRCSEATTDRTVTVGDTLLALPTEATTHEAAAIATAVGASLQDERAAPAEEPTDTESGRARSRHRDQFRFAGRTAAVTGTTQRRPRCVPADNWTAVGRLERR